MDDSAGPQALLGDSFCEAPLQAESRASKTGIPKPELGNQKKIAEMTGLTLEEVQGLRAE